MRKSFGIWASGAHAAPLADGVYHAIGGRFAWTCPGKHISQGIHCVSARVSVVVPLYNKALTIERALTSITRQTYADIDIVVVDDGSTDVGASLVDRFPDDRIRMIRQQNLGPGAARNRGIAESTSDLIAFLDADDEWLPEFLERAISLLDKAEPSVVALTFGYFEGSRRRSTERRWRARGLQSGLVRLVPTTSPTFVVTALAYMNVWATVVRRSAILDYGGFYEANCRYGEDTYLWLKLILNHAICIDLEPLVCWHSEASALSRNLNGSRPVEPFFTDPSGLYEACPHEMRELLHDVLALRAGKTASVLSFWGRWLEGRRLLNRFTTMRDLRYSWVRIGQITSTPMGAGAGVMIRKAISVALYVASLRRFIRSGSGAK